MNFAPTAEQSLILEAVRTTRDNLLIEARAGAAKTTTLLMIAEALPMTSIRCVAFNKKIAEELQSRLPENGTAATMNSLGHRAWSRFLGKRLRLDTSKVFNLFREETAKRDKRTQEAARESSSFILKSVRHAKSQGFITKHAYGKSLLSVEDFLTDLPEEPTSLEEDLILTLVKQNLDGALQGWIDFDDQILCSALFPATFDIAPLTLVDEAQDLSPINHIMLEKMTKRQRLIAVGDPCQAIYAFRGAMEDSMNALASGFNARRLYLTLTFRCPEEIVAEAQWRAPDMTSAAKHSGEVRNLPTWTEADLPDNCAIICRNNAPLLRCALNLIRARRYPELLGNDIMAGLVKQLRSFGKETLSSTAAFDKAVAWFDSKKKKSRETGVLRDRLACIQLFLEQGPTLGDAIAYAETLAKAKGRIKLMTAHKSKGLEFDSVFILDAHLMRDEGQDLNLRYVAQTRAMRQLTYITTDGWTVKGD